MRSGAAYGNCLYLGSLGLWQHGSKYQLHGLVGGPVEMENRVPSLVRALAFLSRSKAQSWAEEGPWAADGPTAPITNAIWWEAVSWRRLIKYQGRVFSEHKWSLTRTVRRAVLWHVDRQQLVSADLPTCWTCWTCPTRRGFMGSLG